MHFSDVKRAQYRYNERKPQVTSIQKWKIHLNANIVELFCKSSSRGERLSLATRKRIPKAACKQFK